MATYTLISSNVLTGTAASVTFSSIPATFTDLVVRVSARGTATANTVGFIYQMNSDTGANYSYTNVQATGSTASSSNNVTEGYSNGIFAGYITGASATADTFGSAEVYIPSYTVSQKKAAGSFIVTERNATTGQYITANAGLWNNTAAITQIDLLLLSGSFVSGSSFYLDGISNA
jgi:hypothetical protein